MSGHSCPPTHLRVDWTNAVTNLPAWLEWVKEATGFSDNTLATCLGTDARQVERWRNDGVVPSGRAMAAIVLLAERIPGAHDRLSRIDRSGPPLRRRAVCSLRTVSVAEATLQGEHTFSCTPARRRPEP